MLRNDEGKEGKDRQGFSTGFNKIRNQSHLTHVSWLMPLQGFVKKDGDLQHRGEWVESTKQDVRKVRLDNQEVRFWTEFSLSASRNRSNRVEGK